MRQLTLLYPSHANKPQTPAEEEEEQEEEDQVEEEEEGGRTRETERQPGRRNREKERKEHDIMIPSGGSEPSIHTVSQ